MQKKMVWSVIALCLLGMFVYSGTLNAPFYFDDNASITRNAAIHNLKDMRAIWDFAPTRFITNLSFALNYHFNRLRVSGYHIVNIALHLCSGVMAWWFLLLTLCTPKMAKSSLSRHKHLVAFLAAAVFITHPLQTQSVNYLVQRSVLLAALLYLFSLCLYIKSGLTESTQKYKSRLYYASSLIAASAGMFTKETTVTLPLMVLAYEFFFLRKEWRKSIPFFAVSLVLPLVLLSATGENSRQMVRILQYSPDIPRLDYLLTQARVSITYLRLLFIPLNQNLDYDYPVSNSILDPNVPLSLILLAFIVLAAWRMRRNNRLASFAVFWFFLTILPESSLVPLKDVIFEHRLYLPMAGFSIFLVSALYGIFKEKGVARATFILFALVAFYSALAYARNLLWQDDVVMYSDTAGKSPAKARCWNNLGDAYAKKGLYVQAARCFKKAAGIRPDYADAYYNLGVIHYKKSDYAQALDYFNRAIILNPQDADAYCYKGKAFKESGKISEAIADFEAALRVNPRLVQAYILLAEAYSGRGENKEAEDLYLRAISAYPDLAELYVRLAVLYGNKGNNTAVISLCRQALKINPDLEEAYANLGGAYGMTGNLKEALRACKKALGINPDSGLACLNLAVVYYEMGEYGLAVEYCQKAKRLGKEIPKEFLGALKAYGKVSF